MYQPTRRAFIRQTACAALGATGVVNTIWDLRRLGAATVPTGDYKALVCLFLYGGNDANNLLIPRDNANYNIYSAARGSLALPKSSLLPINVANSPGPQFGFHPSMPGLQQLFNQNKVALVTNVGTLLAPLTRTQYQNNSVAVPPQLFSHADQAVQWQTSVSDSDTRTGWGGRSADLLQSLNSNSRISMAISIDGTNTFEVGNTVIPYLISRDGSLGLDGFYGDNNSNLRLQAFKQMMTLPRRSLIAQAYADTFTRAIAENEILSAALAGVAPLTTQFPDTDLGAQLKMIAKLIAARSNLSMSRQIFFCAAGGYDTHGDQLGAQSDLLTELSQAMSSFYAATVELGASQQVTTFTASDFGRTFAANGSGSDHGWGSHQLVMGGAVQGAKFYGTFPTLAINGPDDTEDGRWIPTTSVDEFSATLARWFGVSQSDLPTVLPNIGRFAQPNLGFLG